MLRLAAAIVTGYLIFNVSTALWFQFTRQDPHALPGLLLGVGGVVWGIVFAGLGGFVAAHIAGRPDRMASTILAGLIAGGALAAMFLDIHGAWWSMLAALLLMAPAAFAGGFIVRPGSKLAING